MLTSEAAVALTPVAWLGGCSPVAAVATSETAPSAAPVRVAWTRA